MLHCYQGVGHCDDQIPLRSSIGLGPKGDGIGVRVVDNDPYGYYRLQFFNENTGDVLITTPNLDPGSRIYVCSRGFNADEYQSTYSAGIQYFTTLQLGSIRDARVGDIVLFDARKPVSSDDDRQHDFFGIGVITSISSSGSVTFNGVHEFDMTMSSIEVVMRPITDAEIDETLNS